VKRVRVADENTVFQLESREKHLLIHLLELYPRIPAGYQPLSRTAGQDASNQRLLDEALAEERTEKKKAVAELLSDPTRLRQKEDSWLLSLTPAEMEHLLQVLNDIRIGSWVSLGSPETQFAALKEQMSFDFWAMEMAGFFQMNLLGAIEEEGEREGET